MNYKLLSEKQEELIDVYKHDPKLMNNAEFLVWNANREKLESEIASLSSEKEEGKEKPKKDITDAYGGLGSEMDTNSTNYNNLDRG